MRRHNPHNPRNLPLWLVSYSQKKHNPAGAAVTYS